MRKPRPVSPTTTSIRKLITAVYEGKHVRANDEFNNLIKSKVAAKLEEMKLQLINRTFNK